MHGFSISRMEKGSSSSSPSGGGADSLNGLKFGKKIYFEGVGSGLLPISGGGLLLEETTPPRLPAKKGRTTVVQGGQPPRCQVEGCKVDLSDAKAYYCRHKVCGMHSKSPKVIVAGLEQRFCQQCSRFHQLPEFDQGKRSCRRRLAGHNERRRKPPSGPLLSSPYASLSSSSSDNHSKTGGFMMDFSAYSTYAARDSWPNTSAHQTGKYQTAWRSSPQTPPSDLLQSPIIRPSYSGSTSSSEDCFNGVPNSTSALSLLSNSNSFFGTNGSALVQPSVDQFAFPTWDFKVNETTSSLHETPADMGSALISHPSNSQYSRGLRLAQPNDGQYHEIEPSGGYDSSVQHMNWLL